MAERNNNKTQYDMQFYYVHTHAACHRISIAHFYAYVPSKNIVIKKILHLTITLRIILRMATIFKPIFCIFFFSLNTFILNARGL